MALTMDGRSSPSQHYKTPSEFSPRPYSKQGNSPLHTRGSARVGSPKHGLPEEGSGARPVPIPPLVRIGAPTGITNGVVSPNIAGPWRPASACGKVAPKRHFNLPSRWSSGLDSSRCSVFHALGMAPPTSSDELASSDVSKVAAMRLSYAPKSLQQCDEGCYWRWLSHALLEDAAELKRNYDDVQEEHQQRCAEKRGIEEIICNYDRIENEIGSMERKLVDLRVDAPNRREEFRQREEDLMRKQQEYTDLVNRRQSLQEQIKKSIEVQKVKSKLVTTLENDAYDLKQKEKALRAQIATLFEEFQKLEVQNKGLQAEADALRVLVQDLEAGKGRKKKKKGKGKSKSPSAKK